MAMGEFEPGSSRDRCPACGGRLSSRHYPGCPVARGRCWLDEARAALNRIEQAGGDNVDNMQGASSGDAVAPICIRDNNLDAARVNEPRWLGELILPIIKKLRGRHAQ